MSELGGREPEADHEREVEQQFKRSGDTVLFVSILSTHAAGVVVQGVSTGR